MQQQKRFVIPEVVSTHFHVRQGDAVADFGAGSGYFIPVLSELVGQEGMVYACEIQKNLVETVGELARSNNLGNVTVLWSDMETENGTKVPTDALDAGLLINTLFQIEDKDAAFEEIKRTIRPGGKLFIVDWTESFAGLGPHSDQVITAEAASMLAEKHGFTKERTFEAGDHHYGIAFRL